MIKHIKHSDINKSEWDRALSQHENGNVFFSSWYLDAVCERWDAIVEDEYKTIMPIPIVKKMGVDMVYQPFFSRQLGLSGENKSMNEFLQQVPDSIKYFSIGYGEDIDVDIVEVDQAKYQQVSIGDLDKLRASYNSNAKRNIKKALKSDLTIHFDIDFQEVVELFKTIKKDGLKAFAPEDYARLSQLMLNAIDNNAGVAIGAKQEGKIVAACFFLKFGNTITYLKGAANETGKVTGAMHYIFDEAIGSFAKGFDILDFGGSNVDSVARFFKNFGAEDKFYRVLKIDKLPLILSALKKLKNKL